MIQTLPTIDDLAPQLARLEANPGSVILLAIEQPEVCNFCRVTWAWLSKNERQTLKAALERARKKRAHVHTLKRNAYLQPNEAGGGPRLETGVPPASTTPPFDLRKKILQNCRKND